ncbi:putative methionyl-tRNA synthetase [Hordeum vulgare]|nr:putative methionyl-tRNA synthetase [Hordeum vulgare]
MEEIINNGSTVAASCPGFDMQEETLGINEDMDEEDVEVKEEVAEEVEEELVEPKPMMSKGMFRWDSSTDAGFKFLHVFTRIESCEKWVKVCLALAKAKDGMYNLDVCVSWAAEGRPTGTKKAKKVRD